MTENESISESFAKAVALVTSNPDHAVEQLTQLQERIARAALFSTNETLEDLSTNAIPLLALDHYLATALTNVPTGPGSSGMAARLHNLERAGALWSQFLRTLDRLELLSTQHQGECQVLEDLSSGGSDVSDTARMAPPTTHREAKIARHRAKQAAQQAQQRLRALTERRRRLGVEADDTLDGHDDESLQRETALKGLEIHTQEAIEEWTNVIREMPMLTRMVKQLQQQPSATGDDRHGTSGQSDTRQRQQQPPPQSAAARGGPPLQLTHITKDAATGRIQVHRDTAREQVFRRGWNQPTMSLEELADRETAEARARAERQQTAEAARAEAPRRYDQLVTDGMEDRADLVDASADLDRKWDDWKDENPRGSGNKRGDVGDRNF